ncbi:hypothetical protein IFM89_025524 [Coptis chinensis]|uniref:Uncharacterized protein n=1 Tax=Coptis chinensis TaxID=261450 RepID=A0A835LGF9_9MAGN|nr:hypothetical protein IFM89_025524 [Coptis chinensis]
MASVKTINDINVVILSMDYKECKAEMKTIDAQDSYKGGVVVQDPAKLKADGIIVGWGLQRLLDYVKLNYKNPTAIIHENGLPMTSDDSSNPAARNDTARIKFLQMYIKNLLLSIRELGSMDNTEALSSTTLFRSITIWNGSNLKGYFVWSFLDVFEVTGGYTSHFGLYGVDFHDKERRRGNDRKGRYRDVTEAYSKPPYFSQTIPDDSAAEACWSGCSMIIVNALIAFFASSTLLL